jgi:hypothetical protein
VKQKYVLASWIQIRRSRWPRRLRRGFAASRLLGLRVWMPPGAISECRVLLLGRGLCDGLIRRPEESYRMYACRCVWSSATKASTPTMSRYKVNTKKERIQIHALRRYLREACKVNPQRGVCLSDEFLLTLKSLNLTCNFTMGFRYEGSLYTD